MLNYSTSKNNPLIQNSRSCSYIETSTGSAEKILTTNLSLYNDWKSFYDQLLSVYASKYQLNGNQTLYLPCHAKHIH